MRRAAELAAARRPALPRVPREPHGLRLRRLPRLRGAARGEGLRARVSRRAGLRGRRRCAWRGSRDARRRSTSRSPSRACALRNPGARGLGHLRLRARARALLRPAPARRLRGQEPHPRAAPRQPAAAHRRGRGGHAELDQPRERRGRRLRAREAPAHPRGRAGVRERLRHRDRPLRRGLQAPDGRAQGRRARDQRVVPPREGRRHRVRPGSRGAGRPGARHPARRARCPSW